MTATQTTAPSLTKQQPWPDGVTARIVTTMGLRLGNPDATVDITTDPGHGMNAAAHEATCRPCGWTASRSVDRNKVIEKAQDHADGCTALPNPTAAPEPERRLWLHDNA